MNASRRPLPWALAALVVLLAVGLRHHFVWGAGRPVLGVALHVWLGIGEALGVVAFTVLGARAWTAFVDRAPRITTTELLRAGSVVAVVAALLPPGLSSDVFDYVARGRVEVHYGGNPYVTPPAALGVDDPVLALAEWPEFVMPYGPISALAQAACALVAGPVPWLGVFLFKLLCAAAHVATGWLLSRAVPPERAPAALALWLFHPWILLESCVSGHNEALLALWLALMVERAVRGKYTAATFAFGLAVLTKHGCAPIGPLLLAAAVRARRAGAFAAGVLASAALTALLAWRYFTEPGAFAFLTDQTANRGTSLQHFVILLAGPGAAGPLLWSGYAVTIAMVAAAAARVRDVAAFADRSVLVLAVFILVAMPLFSPWYHLWWAPLAAVLPAAAPGARALRALAWLGPLSYLVYAATRRLDLVHQAWAWPIGALLPVGIVLLARRPPAAPVAA
ncbi:MAG TPA: glycosyltransferase 87 family protein [Planctomycetota bacterium]|nr:glycosyltransferase 87 family protein [Planctomycetota bacterium]